VRSRLSRSLTARTLLIGAASALLLIGGLSVLLFAVASQRSAGRLALRSQEAVTAATALEKTAVNLDNGVRGFAATARERALRPFVAGRKLYPAQVRRLKGLVSGDDVERRLVARIGREIDDYVGLWAQPLIGVARDRLDVARQILIYRRGKDRIDHIRTDFARLARRTRQVAAARIDQAESRSNLATVLGVVDVVLVLVLVAGAALVLRRSILRPVRDVAAAAGEVAEGDLTVTVPAERADELGTLARSFNAMTRSLEDSNRTLAERTGELERSNRDLADYASVASHDLQGPLITISMYADVLRQRLDDAGSVDGELAEHISTAAGRLRGLVRDLLTYSRVGQGAMRWERVDLAALVGQVLEDLAGPIEDRGARVELSALPAVRGDRQRLRQLLQNLIANGVKFSRDEPLVEVGASAVGDGGCCVTVRDYGMGFDPEKRDEIFRPFSRLQEASGTEGSGIGLAICERIVHRHGGRIWVDSVPGEGSAFHFTLPLADAGASAEPTWDPEPAPAGA
jgi:signal transduction histidine kinase